MSGAEPTGDYSTNRRRIAVLVGLPAAVALVVGSLTGDARSGFVVGAGIGFGLALAVLTYRWLSA